MKDKLYTGLNDLHMDYFGKVSFLDGGKKPEQFSFRMFNGASSTKFITITSTYHNSLAGIQTATGDTSIAGIITDGVITTGVDAVAANSRLTIENFKKFINQVPCRLTGMIIDSNTENGFMTYELKWYRLHPCKEPVLEKININEVLSPNQYNGKKKYLNFLKMGFHDLVFSDQLVFILPIAGSNVVPAPDSEEILDVTLEFDCAYNSSVALRRRGFMARGNIERRSNILHSYSQGFMAANFSASIR